MPKIKSVFYIFLVFFLYPLFSPIPFNFAQASSGNSNEIIVKYRRPLSLSERTLMHRDITSKLTGRIEKLNIDILKAENQVADTVNKLRFDPRVKYVEPNYIAYAFELTNDPGIINNYQWGLFKIKAADSGISAWDLSKGNKAVITAVLDTGIDIDHEDLKGKIISSKNCTDSNTYDDRYGHGTHVAGIIAAFTNNNIGAAGVGYQTSLINAKALGDSGSGYYSWIADCIVWATDQGAKVINMSLGGTNSSRLLEDAVNYAYSKGVLLVAASGNSGQSNPSYPAAYKNVLAVAATDINDSKAGFSNYGDWVDVAAPGVNIYSTLPNHYNTFNKYNYGYLSGTSMAAPFVSGLASLLFSLDGQSNKSVIDYINNNSDITDNSKAYWKYGRINAYKSLLAALSEVNSKITPSPTFYPASTPFLVPSLVPTATPTLIPTNVPTATPTPTTIPTLTPTYAPTPVPLATVIPITFKNPKSKLCARFPKFCN